MTVILIKILQFIASLSLLIIIHELGHFLFARLFKVRVEKFYLFFDPWFSLFKFKKGDTEYGIGWLPFGGYVKISGMIDESMDLEQMKQPPQPYEFRSKPAWQRLLIMLGGVIMNVVLAFVIFIGMSYVWGDQYQDNRDMRYGYAFNQMAQEIGFRNGDKIIDVGGESVEEVNRIVFSLIIDQAPYVTVERDGQPLRIEVPEGYTAQMLQATDFILPRMPYVVGENQPGSGAEKAGLLPGDSLIVLNGQSLQFLDQFQAALADHKNQTVEVGLVRDSARITQILTVPIQVSEEGKFEVYPANVMPVRTKHYTFWQSIPVGFKKTGTELADYAKQIKLIFTPKTEAYKSVGGFLSIGNIFPGEWNWQLFWRLTAFLSIALAVFNILPIPALDGGHVFFLLYEVITGRKPNEKFMEYVQVIGLLLIFTLIILVNANDIYRLFFK